MNPTFHRRNFISFTAAGVLSSALPVHAQFRVEVSGVGLTQMPIAVSTFKGEAQAPQKIGAIVKADLERSGVFAASIQPGLRQTRTRGQTSPNGGKRALMRWSPVALRRWPTAASTFG
jgi:Tol biopolymer transport system component